MSAFCSTKMVGTWGTPRCGSSLAHVMSAVGALTQGFKGQGFNACVPVCGCLGLHAFLRRLLQKNVMRISGRWRNGDADDAR